MIVGDGEKGGWRGNKGGSIKISTRFERDTEDQDIKQKYVASR